MLNKEDLEKLAALSQIELKAEEENSLLNDLKTILDHFEELKELKTENVPPLRGGTFNFNVLRKDEEGEALEKFIALQDFPLEKDGYLIIPNIFD
jgi:glutamyl-tRNA(Gln) and/or aspartyl-tRNA(Asn) amidotransferase, C subunit